MIGDLIRRYLVRVLDGVESVYPWAGAKVVEESAAAYGVEFPMASITCISTTEENDGPELEAA